MVTTINYDNQLRESISRGGVVFVVGSGISIAASWDPSTGKSHPQASWPGLLENGLEWLKQHSHMPDDEAAAHLILMKKRGEIYHFVSAAEDITRLMGGVESQHFKNWLEQTIGSIKAYNRDVLDPLESLRMSGNLLATTNYDGLLLDDSGHLKPVTWKEPEAFLRAARNRENDKIIFLHGYWREPQSVVLDWKSYQDITRDEQYRADFATIWQMTTWIFIGCGVNGLNDPDFGLILERYGKRARQAGLWDFCLVRQDQRADFQAHFDRLGVNICAVSFGDSYDKLPQYLLTLLPATKVTSAFVTASPSEPLIAFLRVTDRFLQYRHLVDTMGPYFNTNAGDFRFTADEFRLGQVHRPQVVDLAINCLRRDGMVWLQGPIAGGKTTVFLHLVNEWDQCDDEPLYLDLGNEPDVAQAAREITAYAKSGRIFVLDNVHVAPKVACSLLDHWNSQRCDSVMVLEGWPTDIHPRHDYLSGYRKFIISVTVQPEDWIGVYQSIFRLIRGSGQFAPIPPPHVLKTWDDNFAADLVTFQYALAARLRWGSGIAFDIDPAAALCLNIDVASNEEANYEIFESPEGEHSEKGNAA